MVFEAWVMTRKRKTKRPASSRTRRRRKKPQGKSYAGLVADAGVFCFSVLIGLAALFAYFARDLPDTNTLWRDRGAPKITLLAADNSPIRIHGTSMGAPVRLADLPAHVPAAILAVEDRNFYHHFGVNPVSVMRALIVNAKQGGVVQGGSTITQQLAKNVFLSADRTVKRKAQEFLLALWLEQKFTKEEILTLYLNRVYFGAGAYGIDAASHRYFAKPAEQLEIGEAAMLAGLLKAPSRFAPTSNPEDAGRRGRLVIDQMVAAGFLTPAKAASVLDRPILLSAPQFSTAPYFVDHALQTVRGIAGDLDADLMVWTTFDPSVQAAAELGLVAGAAVAPDDLSESQSAVVIMDGEGAVRAMIGGRDYRTSQFNRAVQAKRQPGSAFKPFVFLAAIESGYRTDDYVMDAPVSVGKWAPNNYDGKYFGEVTLREALARSLNGATVRVQEATGRSVVRQTARAMGWPGSLNPGPSLALGVDAVSPLDLAGAYAPFANGGYRIKPRIIDRIETADGDLIYQRSGPVLEQAASASAISDVNQMMRAVVDWGTGGNAAVAGYHAAGKTGTTQNNRDGWFAGHAGGLVGVVWVGRDDNAPMPNVTGGRAPAVIWREIMARALPPRYVAPLIAPVIDPAFEADDDPIADILGASG
ncbi:Penicillin-binding protein 1B (PBP-1b) (PBP1b) (Murein polymerase) [Includes: Penicillin-insensitive transglycosylase (Peptidoglycan TGase) (Peptidoglycan glycosyltransferase) [Durusdinium trenchii]|uniref:peptidoglycan glycosyltransferase n=1 Tax=Durusdinium trenchii TaxID=1381693 RepID=A0ABP0LJQ8_9DINO